MSHCPERSDIQTCLKQLDDQAYETYTNFFLYSTSFCQDIQQDRWHRQTGVVINELSKASIDTVELLQHSRYSQQQLLERSETAIELQEGLMAMQQDLKETVVTSTRDLEQLKSKVEENFEVISGHYNDFLNMQVVNMKK